MAYYGSPDSSQCDLKETIKFGTAEEHRYNYKKNCHEYRTVAVALDENNNIIESGATFRQLLYLLDQDHLGDWYEKAQGE